MAYPSRKQILQDFRTRSLLQATRSVIASDGFEAVTMERVAREAGLTKGGIYLYFRNKDQMTMAALQEIALEMLREIESRVDAKALPWVKLSQVVRAQLESMERHRDVTRTLLLLRWRLSNRGERKKWQRLLQHRERHLARLKKILDEGVRRKAFCPMDTAMAAFYINEITISTAQKRMMGQSPLSLEKEAQGLIRFLALLLKDRAKPLPTEKK